MKQVQTTCDPNKGCVCSCSSKWGDCNNNMSDGCEVSMRHCWCDSSSSNVAAGNSHCR
jgi:hypothetical protein